MKSAHKLMIKAKVVFNSVRLGLVRRMFPMNLGKVALHTFSGSN